jgi:putative transposase
LQLQALVWPINKQEKWQRDWPADASLQKFTALHGSIHNHFNQERHLSCRPTFKERRAAALTEWRQLCAA